VAILNLLKGGLDLIIARVGRVIIASAGSDNRRYIPSNEVLLGFPIWLSRLKGTGPKLNSAFVGANEVAVIIDADLVGVFAGFILTACLLVAFGASNFGHAHAVRAHFTNIAFCDNVAGLMAFTIGPAEKTTGAIGTLRMGGRVFTGNAG